MRKNPNKEKIASIFMNDIEFQMLKDNAKKAGISQSSYLRELLINTNYVQNRKLFEEFLTTNKLLLENLHRIGSNLNQIAHALNMDITQSNSEILAVFQSLQELLKEYKSFMMSSKYPKLLKKRKFGNEE